MRPDHLRRLRLLVAEWRAHARDDETDPAAIDAWRAAADELAHELASDPNDSTDDRQLGTGGGTYVADDGEE